VLYAALAKVSRYGNEDYLERKGFVGDKKVKSELGESHKTCRTFQIRPGRLQESSAQSEEHARPADGGERFAHCPIRVR
jgi:hypothetical protein